MNELAVLIQYAHDHPRVWLLALGILGLYVILANYKPKAARDVDARLSQMLPGRREVDTAARPLR